MDESVNLPAGTIWRCHAALERAMEEPEPIERRLALRQHPELLEDGLERDWACKDVALLPPFSPLDRKLLSFVARLYGFDLVALDEHGKQRLPTRGASSA